MPRAFHAMRSHGTNSTTCDTRRTPNVLHRKVAPAPSTAAPPSITTPREFGYHSGHVFAPRGHAHPAEGGAALSRELTTWMGARDGWNSSGHRMGVISPREYPPLHRPEPLVELRELAREAFFLHLRELFAVHSVQRDDH